MKKAVSTVVIAAFLLILIVPLFATNFKADAVSERDNRALAQSPFKAHHDGARLSDAIDNYFSDRIGFRNELIGLNSRLTYSVFKKSPVDRVILGKDGWLFYNGEASHDGAPIAQYIGKSRYTDEQLKAFADNLEKTRAYLEQRDCEFVVFIAPNKEHVYSEYMPDTMQDARVSEYCCTDQLVDYLKENTSIRVVYPYDDLKAFKQSNPETPVYYHLDTHWNMLGGYIGARALLAELGIDIPAADKLSYSKIEENSGDLYNMLMCDDWLSMKETDWNIPNYPADDTTVAEENYSTHWRYFNKNKDPRKIMIKRDSFTTAMRLVLGSYFNEADFVHNNTYTPDLIETEAPDIFVWEVVERYQGGLANSILPE